MRRLMITLTAMWLLSITAVCGQSNTSSGADIKFATMTHDFGTFVFKGEPRSFSFEFENSGTEPLVIVRTTTSCSCIKIDYPRRPVAAGGKGVIKVTYTPKKDLGVFNKGVQVYSNVHSGRTMLLVKGNVVEQQ